MRQIKPAYLNTKKRCDVLCFGGAPNEEDMKKGEMFSGSAGQLLKDAFKIELPSVKVVFDNVIPFGIEDKHGVEGKGRPSRKLLKEWEAHRLSSIINHKPRVIMALGDWACKAFEYKDPKVTRESGKLFSYPFVHPSQVANEIPCVISVHPSYCETRPKDLHLLRRSLQAVKSSLKGHKKEKFHEVTTLKELKAMLKVCAKQTCAFDIETTGFDAKHDNVLLASIQPEKGKAFYIPLFHPSSFGKEANRRWNELLLWWNKGPRVVHNAMMEVDWMGQEGTRKAPKIYDTMLMAWLHNEDAGVGLKDLVTRVLEKPPYWTDIDLENCSSHSLEDLGTYCAYDSKYTMDLFKLFKKKLTPKMMRIHDEILIPLVNVLIKMQNNGIKINVRKLRKLKKDMEAKVALLEAKVAKSFRKEAPDLNVRSTPQMRKLFFKTLKLPVQGVTTNGQPSCDADTIHKLKRMEPRLKVLAEVREIQTFIGTTLKKWLELVDEEGFLHTKYAIAFTKTGRLSSRNPNLQNIDRNDDEKRPWKGTQRLCMMSRFKGGSLIQYDYEQHEFRIVMADIGQENALKRIRQGMDPHQVSAELMKVPRTIAKNCNFSQIYHGDEHTLKNKYNVPLSIGVPAREKFFQVYDKLTGFHHQCVRDMKKLGYVKSMFGWRRRLGNIHDDRQVNQAINFKGQNPAVVICYIAMNEVDQFLMKGGYQSVLIHHIHDSIVLDAHPDEVDIMNKEVTRIMIGVNKRVKKWTGVDIPLGVEAKVSKHL